MATVLNDGETIQSHFDEEDALFEAIEKLITQGMINAGDVGGLQEAGIRNFSGLVNHISENPSGVTGISKAKLDQIYQTSEIILERKAEKKWKTTNIIEKKSLSAKRAKIEGRIAELIEEEHRTELELQRIRDTSALRYEEMKDLQQQLSSLEQDTSASSLPHGPHPSSSPRSWKLFPTMPTLNDSPYDRDARNANLQRPQIGDNTPPPSSWTLALVNPEPRYPTRPQIGDNTPPSSSRTLALVNPEPRKRLDWTPELEQKFMRAVDSCGGLERATPKGLLEFFKGDGLTGLQLKSHLSVVKDRYKAAQERSAHLANQQEAQDLAAAAHLANQQEDEQNTLLPNQEEDEQNL